MRARAPVPRPGTVAPSRCSCRWGLPRASLFPVSETPVTYFKSELHLTIRGALKKQWRGVNPTAGKATWGQPSEGSMPTPWCAWDSMPAAGPEHHAGNCPRRP